MMMYVLIVTHVGVISSCGYINLLASKNTCPKAKFGIGPELATMMPESKVLSNISLV